MNLVNFLRTTPEPDDFKTYEEYRKDKFLQIEQRVASISTFDPNANLSFLKGDRILSNEKTFHIYPYDQSKVCNELRRILDKIYEGKLWKTAGRECERHFNSVDLLKEIKSIKNATTISCHSYSISHFTDHFERISGFSIDEIQLQAEAYGIRFIANKYFNHVTDPREGDLVIYSSDEGDQHSGIFKPEQIVESLWNSKKALLKHRIFQHPLFFIPTRYGNEVNFYRPKDIICATPSYDFTNQGPMYIHTKENDAIREKIVNLKRENLVKEFPEIEWEKDIQFNGYCYGYALGKIFKTYKAPEGFSWIMPRQKELDKWFTSTLEPQAGDLAVYYEHEGGKIVHFGVYMADGRIESKWGSDDVYRHPPFFVEPSYGNFIRYYHFDPKKNRLFL